MLFCLLLIALVLTAHSFVSLPRSRVICENSNWLMMRNDGKVFGVWRNIATASIGLSILVNPMIAVGDDSLKSKLADIQYEKVAKTNAVAPTPVNSNPIKKNNVPPSTTVSVSKPTDTPANKAATAKAKPAVTASKPAPKATSGKKVEPPAEVTYTIKKDEKLLNSVNSVRKVNSLTTIQGAAGYLDSKVTVPRSKTTATVSKVTKPIPEELSYESAVAKTVADRSRRSVLNFELQGLKKVSGSLQGSVNSLESKIQGLSRGLKDKNSPSSKKAELYKLKLDAAQQQAGFIKELKKVNELTKKESSELDNIKKRLVIEDKDVTDKKKALVAKEIKLRVDAKNAAIKAATGNLNFVKNKLDASKKDIAAKSVQFNALKESLKAETAALKKAVASIESLESKLERAKGLEQTENAKVTELDSKVIALNQDLSLATSAKNELQKALSDATNRLSTVK